MAEKLGSDRGRVAVRGWVPANEGWRARGGNLDHLLPVQLQ